MSFGFIVSSCLRTEEHLLSLNECINSIQKFHSNKIIVIMDFTNNKELENIAISNNPTVIFELNTEHIPADMLFCYYFKLNKYFDKAILFQDSMRLKMKMNIDDIKDIKYLWHFTNHRLHWSTITEPETDFNIKNNIISHDDLNMFIINNIITNDKFKDYCLKTYYNKNEWCGCFGTCCIITYDFINKLDNETDIINIQKQMYDNRLRRSIESIFSLAVQFVTGRIMEDGYDGLYYDGINGNNLNGNVIYKKSFNRL